MKNKLIKICSIIAVIIVLVTMTVIPTFAATADSQSSSDTMILKAGTYRWNDTLHITDDVTNEPEVGSSTRQAVYEFVFSIFNEGQSIVLNYISLEKEGDGGGMGYISNEYGLILAYNDSVFWTELPFGQIITISNDTEVCYIYGTWFIANTNYNEVNAPDVPIAVGQTRYWNETLNSLNYTFYATDEFSYTSDGVTYSSMTIGKSSPTDFASSYAVKYGSSLVYGLSQSSGWVDQRDRYFTLNSLPDNEDVVAFILANSTVVDSSQGDAYDRGYSDGYHQGVIDGEEIGYDEGYTTGHDDGYFNGYEAGELAGYSEGYMLGYIEGLNATASENFGENLLGSTLSAPMNALNQFVIYQHGNVTITLGLVVGSMLALIVFIAFLKLFAGG